MEMYELSKTTYLRGIQCQKSLYLNRHHADRRNPPDPNLESKLNSGQQIHKLARELFPGGELAIKADSFDPVAAVRNTEHMLQTGVEVIYEAAFLANRILVFVDVLERVGKRWNLYEVKGTTSIKEEHFPDLAVQAHVMQSTGMELEDMAIVHLNSDYVRQGELELQKIFRVVSIKHELRGSLGGVADQIRLFVNVLNRDQTPTIDLGPYCSEPYDCDFTDHCWRHIPRDSVFDVARLSKRKKFDLYRRGVLDIDDIPQDYPMGEVSRFHVDHHISGETHLNRPAVKEFLDSLTYPLFFLDFETLNPAIPPYDGLRPYQQIPFQFSIHVQEEPNGKTNHSGFLAEAGDDPRPAFVDELLKATAGTGSLVVYNKTFEAQVLKGLMEYFPALEQELGERLARLVDLMGPFRAQDFYIPAMSGSFSLKAVLPVLVDDLSYSGLSISDGQAAMDAYVGLQSETDPGMIETIRRDLWEYCKLDTLAMVRILEKLSEAA